MRDDRLPCFKTVSNFKSFKNPFTTIASLPMLSLIQRKTVVVASKRDDLRLKER